VSGRRILVTGLSTYWGGRLAHALEQRADVEAIVGVDSRDPTRELVRTEFVRVSNQHSLLRRIVRAAEIDTVVDTRLVVDSAARPTREAIENNSIGTLNILAACSESCSPVRKLVFKSSAHYYGCGPMDPAFFTEEMHRDHAPATPLKRSIVEAEASVGDFSAQHPDVTVTTLRCCNVLGSGVDTSHARLLSLPAVPMILGFDPRYQFIHSDDVVAALEFAVEHDLAGTYNAAPDGVLVLSEVADLLGKRALPLLPPWGTGLAVGALRPFGFRIPQEVLLQLRYGRAIDNRKLKAAGFRCSRTTRETVTAFAGQLRLRSVMGRMAEPYRYEKEVEDFLRRSPSVRRRSHPGEPTRYFPPAPPA
jgi:UDP-glucose 4-epimerase